MLEWLDAGGLYTWEIKYMFVSCMTMFPTLLIFSDGGVCNSGCFGVVYGRGVLVVGVGDGVCSVCAEMGLGKSWCSVVCFDELAAV